MNCDQVFAVLTRGPFPTGAPSDHLVEAHLEVCGECWQIAEALRPALEVFQEAVPPAESRDLPGYWGDARPAAAVLSEYAAHPSRTALAPLVRRTARPRHYVYFESRDQSQWSDVVKVTAFIAGLTAGAVGLSLLLQSW